MSTSASIAAQGRILLQAGLDSSMLTQMAVNPTDASNEYKPTSGALLLVLAGCIPSHKRKKVQSVGDFIDEAETSSEGGGDTGDTGLGESLVDENGEPIEQ